MRFLSLPSVTKYCFCRIFSHHHHHPFFSHCNCDAQLEKGQKFRMWRILKLLMPALEKKPSCRYSPQGPGVHMKRKRWSRLMILKNTEGTRYGKTEHKAEFIGKFERTDTVLIKSVRSGVQDWFATQGMIISWMKWYRSTFRTFLNDWWKLKKWQK